MPEIHAEGVVYETLTNARVRNIPACLASGDIFTSDYHTTITHSYATKAWACHSHTHFIRHRHYRLVLDVIGRPLIQYISSFEMVSAVRDAVVGEFLQSG